MQLLPNLDSFYVDANGAELAGGKVYSYIASTSTPQATYTDADGGTANDNPVVLDANGRADIWIDPALSYKFVIKDSAGNTLKTINKVRWIPNGSVITASIADGAVTEEKIGDNEISGEKLEDGCVTENKIADGAVTSNKIENGAITQAKTDNYGLLPPGLIVGFGGSVAPSGWLICDGTSYLRATYPALATALQASGAAANYGAADATHFNVPDYRGRFIRGWDHGAGNDPDAASRTASATGGTTGDSVGSIQADQYKSHTHVDPGIVNPGSNAASGSNVAGYGTSGNTGPSGGNETRPKNGSAQFIIKT